MATCERCGRETRLLDYPCDSVNCTVERLIRFWPGGYPNRTAALEQLLATGGNGYEWDRGALVDAMWDKEIYHRRREDLEKTLTPLNVLPPADWMDEEEKAEAQAAYDAEKTRLRDLQGRAAEMSTTAGPLRTDPWTKMAMCKTAEQRRYLVNHWTINVLPEDVRDDWRAAADELSAVITPLREMLSARLEAAEAEAAETREALDQAGALLSGGTVRIPDLADKSWSLGCLLRVLAQQGHDVHEAPYRPENSGMWECTTCGDLYVTPEDCPGYFAYQVARRILDNLASSDN
jgi:hypothetical protein